MLLSIIYTRRSPDSILSVLKMSELESGYIDLVISVFRNKTK